MVHGAVTQKKEAEQPSAGQSGAENPTGTVTQRGTHAAGGGFKPAPIPGALCSHGGRKTK